MRERKREGRETEAAAAFPGVLLGEDFVVWGFEIPRLESSAKVFYFI